MYYNIYVYFFLESYTSKNVALVGKSLFITKPLIHLNRTRAGHVHVYVYTTI